MVGSEYIALSQGTIGITWLLCSSAVTRSEAVGGRWGQSLLNEFGQAGFVVGPSRVKQPRLVCQCLGRSHSHRSHMIIVIGVATHHHQHGYYHHESQFAIRVGIQ